MLSFAINRSWEDIVDGGKQDVLCLYHQRQNNIFTISISWYKVIWGNARNQSFCCLQKNMVVKNESGPLCVEGLYVNEPSQNGNTL